jgi:HEAT repeat protein/beta-lactamase regulating signal transducer with metallopeptidase domain
MFADLSPLAADALLKTTILLALVAAATLLLRRRSAALRHLVWTLGVAGLVVVPLLAWLAPFQLRVLPPPSAEPTPVAATTPTDRASAVDAPLLEHAEPDRLAHAPARPDAESPVAPTDSAAGAGSPFTLAFSLLSVWFAGALALFARFGRGVVKVRRIARRASVVTDERWHQQADRAGRILNVTTPVDIRRSDDVVMPFACGLLHPTIVLPSSADDWSAERREAVLMHEYAHISRGDLAMNTLAHLVRAIYWFHPLAWIAAHRIRVEGERACDDAVLRAGARPSDYAEHLLSIVRTVGATVPSAALAMARRSDFEGRLLAILEPGIPRFGLTRWRAAALAALFLGAVMPLAAMAPAMPVAPAGGTLVNTSNVVTQNPSPPAAPVPQEPRTREVAAPAERPAQQPAGAVGALIETLGDANASVRIAAANSLGQLGDPRAIAALAKALREDTDARVREAAAYALGQIDDPRAVPHLLAALKTERAPNVREKIVSALHEIDDPSAVAGVIAVLKDPSVAVRRAAVHALGEFEDASAVSALLDMVKDEDAEVRKYTAEALGSLESPSAIEPLAQLARDPDKDVRISALSALGSLEDRRALPALVAALKDANAEVRYHAADAIGDLDGLRTAPPALIEALSDSDSEVRQNAANSLGSIGDEAAVPALKRLTADTDTEVRRAAAEALSEIGGADAIQALMGMLRDPDPEIRKIVAEALGSKR